MFESFWCSRNEIRDHLMFYKMVFDPSLDLNHYGHIYSAIFSRQDLSKFRYYFLTTIQKPTMNLGVVDSIWQVTSDCSALEIKKFLETGWELVPHYLSKTIFGGYLFEVICVSHFNINYVIIEIKNVCFRTYFVFIVSNSSIFHVLDECLSNHFIPFHLLVPSLKNTGSLPKFIFG